MKRYLSCALLLVGCSGADLPPVDGSAAEVDAMPQNVGSSRQLARFDAGGHVVEIYEMSPGSLLIAEQGRVEEPSTLRGLVGTVSLAELYSSFVEGEVPAALIEFDGRAPEAVARLAEAPVAEAEMAKGAPRHASELPGVQPQHEAGGAHFASEHCAEEPASGAAYLGRDPVAVRRFCWSAGYTNSWTEAANAGVFTHEIAAVNGDICYTAEDDTTSRSFEVLEGGSLRVWRSNEIVHYDVPCPSGAVCSGLGLPQVKRMAGRIGCASGDTWRFGGGFWKPNPSIYTPG